MKEWIVIVILNLWLTNSRALLTNRTFPKKFMFGVATSAYQTEGASDTDTYGKTETIWDTFIQKYPDKIMDRSNAFITCDSYHKYKEDVALAADMGMQYYRFSISWSRVLPHPTSQHGLPNEIGIEFYQSLVDEIVHKSMIPVATLYHWDLPQSIEEAGGWLNDKIIRHFVVYARLVIEKLPKVGIWLTINEPKMICNWGYGNGKLAPGKTSNDYQCAYIVLKAHAAVYDMYKKNFPNYKAKMSIVLNGQWSEPATNASADILAAERRNQFEFGLYAHPIFFGNWPPTVIDRVKGETTDGKPRLPTFTDDEKEMIKGSVDFLAFNTFSTFLVQNFNYNTTESYESDVGVHCSVNASWSKAVNGFPIVPWGMKKFLLWIQKEYNAPEIMITENGVADDGASLNDDQRIFYYSGYLNAVLDAIDEGVNVTCFTVWSLLDSFEWTYGYKYRFGLYHVNFSNPNLTRTPKKSVGFFKDLIKDYKIPKIPDNPNNDNGNRAHINAVDFVLVLFTSYVLIYFS